MNFIFLPSNELQQYSVIFQFCWLILLIVSWIILTNTKQEFQLMLRIVYSVFLGSSYSLFRVMTNKNVNKNKIKYVRERIFIKKNITVQSNIFISRSIHNIKKIYMKWLQTNVFYDNSQAMINSKYKISVVELFNRYINRKGKKLPII